jgi:hypothetical protein
MDLCEHARMEHAYGTVWECVRCGWTTEYAAEDFGFPGTRQEERE